MKRLNDWHARLVGYLHSATSTPFQYGHHDCTLFAAGAVRAMTGEDLAEGYRGRYTTLSGGLRVLRKAGYASHVDLVASVFEEVEPVFAVPGDLVVIESEDGDALGVVQGEAVYVLGMAGLSLVSAERARRAFRV
jgi:hypothetical protein